MCNIWLKICLDEDTTDLEDVVITPLKPSPESSSLMYFDLETQLDLVSFYLLSLGGF